MTTAGLRHIFNATQYSIAGLIVLLREKAARLEVGMMVGSLAMLVLLNGRFLDYTHFTQLTGNCDPLLP